MLIKIIKFTIKFKIFDFHYSHIPFCNFQINVSEKNVVLLNLFKFCLCVYIGFQTCIKNPYKHRFIAGSSKCSTKLRFIILTKLLTHIKQGLQKYCETAYSRSGINQMWILKNSKELLEHLKSPTFSHVTSIKSFDFSTLYTTIPHQKLKNRLTSIIRIFKDGNRRYKYLVLIRALANEIKHDNSPVVIVVLDPRHD